jgi:hypothetical protein
MEATVVGAGSTNALITTLINPSNGWIDGHLIGMDWTKVKH